MKDEKAADDVIRLEDLALAGTSKAELSFALAKRRRRNRADTLRAADLPGKELRPSATGSESRGVPARLPHDAVSAVNQHSPTPAPLLPSKFPRIADLRLRQPDRSILRLSRSAPALSALHAPPCDRSFTRRAGLVLRLRLHAGDQHWFPIEALSCSRAQPDFGNSCCRTQLAVWFSCGHAVCLQSGRQGRSRRAARNSPAPTRSSLSGGCMAAKKSPKVKDLPRKAIDPETRPTSRAGWLRAEGRNTTKRRRYPRFSADSTCSLALSRHAACLRSGRKAGAAGRE